MQVKQLAVATAAVVICLGAALAAWTMNGASPSPWLAAAVPALFLALLMLCAAWTLGVVRPLLQLKSELERLARGDFAARPRRRGFGDLREMSADLDAVAQRLEERREEQLRFISNVVHDLRNPLHSIAMASELLELKNDSNATLVQSIFRQVSNLDTLLSDLLDISRIQAGELVLKRSREDLALLLGEALERSRKGDEVHHFVVELSSSTLPCFVDARRMARVLDNLLSNAVKYSPHGGQIKAAAWRDGTSLWLSVSDQGLGVAQEERERIFKPFYGVRHPGFCLPGKGLGLSTSRHIVEAHGGVLTVESRPGHGSTFSLRIPASAPSGAEKK